MKIKKTKFGMWVQKRFKNVGAVRALKAQHDSERISKVDESHLKISKSKFEIFNSKIKFIPSC